MSYDHKPENEGEPYPVPASNKLSHNAPGESARIRAAGGYVEFGRVNGLLSEPPLGLY